MTVLFGDSGRVVTGAKKTFTYTLGTPFEKLLGTPIAVPNVATQPATPIDSYTVTSDTFTTISPQPIEVHNTGFLMISGKCNDTVNKTMNYTIKKNGVDVYTNQSFAAVANQFWTLTIYKFYDIQPGDVIDIYLWGAGTALHNYDYLGFYTLPTNVCFSNAKALKDLVFNMSQVPALTLGTPVRSTAGSLQTYPTNNVSLNIGSGTVTVPFFGHALINNLMYKTQYGADNLTGVTNNNHAVNHPNFLSMYTPFSVSFREIYNV